MTRGRLGRRTITYTSEAGQRSLTTFGSTGRLVDLAKRDLGVTPRNPSFASEDLDDGESIPAVFLTGHTLSTNTRPERLPGHFGKINRGMFTVLSLPDDNSPYALSGVEAMGPEHVEAERPGDALSFVAQRLQLVSK